MDVVNLYDLIPNLVLSISPCWTFYNVTSKLDAERHVGLIGGIDGRVYSRAYTIYR